MTRSTNTASLLRRSPTAAWPQARHDPVDAEVNPSELATGLRSHCGDDGLVGRMDEQHPDALVEATRPDCEGVANLDGRIVAKYPTYHFFHALGHTASNQRGFVMAHRYVFTCETCDAGLLTIRQYFVFCPQQTSRFRGECRSTSVCRISSSRASHCVDAARARIEGVGRFSRVS